MSAPLFHDAAFRWTESGQDYIHYLGSKLRRPVADTFQQVHSWASPDGTTIRSISIGSGVQDLRAQIRYDGMTESLRRFMAAARRKASLEYFPSLANPSESYPCVLMSDDGIELDADFWWNRRNAVGVVLRRIDGGSWLGVVSGSLFYWKAGNSAPGLTFTRSGAVGPYIDEDGVLQAAAANILRTDWRDTDGDGRMDTPLTLLEAGRTNLVDEDDLTAWSAAGTPVVTANADGTYTIEDDDGAASEYVERVVSFTGDGVKAVVFVVRENAMASAGNQQLVLRDITAPATIIQLDITGWVDGEPTITATTGTYLGQRYIGDGRWAVYGSGTVVAANSNRVRVIPAVTASATGSIDVYRVNAFDATTPSHSILDASEVRNADTLYSDFLHAPQEMTGYLKFTPVGVEQAANLGLLRIGDATASTGASLQIFTGTAKRLNLWFNNGVDAVVQQVFGASGEIDYQDDVELRYVLSSTGALTFEVAVAGVSLETVTASAPASGLPAAWVGSRIYHGSLGSSNQGLAAIEESKILPGSKTMAEMRAA